MVTDFEDTRDWLERLSDDETQLTFTSSFSRNGSQSLGVFRENSFGTPAVFSRPQCLHLCNRPVARRACEWILPFGYNHAVLTGSAVSRSNVRRCRIGRRSTVADKKLANEPIPYLPGTNGNASPATATRVG